jgi:hypothetical protein
VLAVDGGGGDREPVGVDGGELGDVGRRGAVVEAEVLGVELGDGLTEPVSALLSVVAISGSATARA